LSAGARRNKIRLENLGKTRGGDALVASDGLLKRLKNGIDLGDEGVAATTLFQRFHLALQM
jgi:hypothetical protein